MALDYGDIEDFFDGAAYFTAKSPKYPQGKQYTIPPMDSETALWFRLMQATINTAILADSTAVASTAVESMGKPPFDESLTFAQLLLGAELVAELAADKVSDPLVQHITMTTYARVIGGDQMALRYAHGADSPKAPANRAERRAAAKAKPKPVKKAQPVKPKASASRTTSTAEGSTTRVRASGSTTTKPAKAAAKKTASRGAKS
jgi:hypothetical protein